MLGHRSDRVTFTCGGPSFIAGEVGGLTSSLNIRAWGRNHAQHTAEGSGLESLHQSPVLKQTGRLACDAGLLANAGIAVTAHAHGSTWGARGRAALPWRFQETSRATRAPISWQPGLTFVLVFAISGDIPGHPWNIRGQGGQAQPCPGVWREDHSQGPAFQTLLPSLKTGTAADPTQMFWPGNERVRAMLARGRALSVA